jgi:fumarylacetoacetase
MNPSLKTWVEIPKDSDFTIYNLPYGIYQLEGKKPNVGVAIGEQILDLNRLAKYGFLNGLDIPREVFKSKTLNKFIALGKPTWNALRKRLITLLSENSFELPKLAHKVLHLQKEAKMLMPIKVGDYTDFYSSMEHATNVGMMFRDPENALLPNWKHLPVGYHGRSSSIFVSGTPIYRPKGQTMPAGAEHPVFGPSKLLDIELEMAFIVGGKTNPGKSIKTSQADDYIFGMVLFNDWSARDIQKWEYVPLGPFLGKNFASSISPWVVTMEALAPFKVAGPKQEPSVLPYLEFEGDQNYDIQLEVALQPENEVETVISRSNFKYMYWNMAQQLAHHTINGCNVRVGDLMASGTISGKDKDSYGSLLELSWSGKNKIPLNGGSVRTFLEDNDTVTIKGWAEKDGIRVGFGAVTGKISPAL